jgi:hypothetical protein
LAVAAHVGGATGALLALTARSAFMSGAGVALGVGAAVAIGGSLLALTALPSGHATAALPSGHATATEAQAGP